MNDAAPQRKLLYYINPISGTKDKTRLVKTIHELTKAAGIPYHVEHTNAAGDYSYLPGLISNERYTDVIICGGDGSVSTVSSYLLDCDINIGIIPTGSGNGLALAAGIPYSTARAIRIILQGNASLIDGFWVNDKFSCMMCGVGNDAEIAHEFALTKVRGLKTYLYLSAKKYLTLKPYSFTLKVAGNTFPVDAFFITISNANQFGNNVTIAPRASLSDGLLDVVIVKKMNRLSLPFALLNQITGINKLTDQFHNKKNQGIIYFQGTEISILNNHHAPLHIDGEPFAAADEINIKIIPNAFRLLQPSRSAKAVQ